MLKVCEVIPVNREDGTTLWSSVIHVGIEAEYQITYSIEEPEGIICVLLDKG